MANTGSKQPAAEGNRLLSLWQQVRPELLRLARALGCPGDAAEDAVQDVYVSAIQAGVSGLEPSDLRAWLFRVTINRCRLEHRRRSRWRRAFGKLAAWMRPREEAGTSDASPVDREALAAVRAALEDLDEDLRVVLVLRYFLDMDSRQIGRTLALNDSTVRSRLRAGRLILADVLRKAGHVDGS